MADNLSDDKQPAAPGMETPSDPGRPEAGRLDRRGFLRALSGSALTVVAGGLTVTLAACQGASTSSPLISSTGVTATQVSLSPASSISGTSLGSFTISSGTSLGSFVISSSSIGRGESGSLNSTSTTPSSNSNSSNSNSSNSNSSNSNSSNSSNSSGSAGTTARPRQRQAMASLQPRDFVPDGWSTRA